MAKYVKTEQGYIDMPNFAPAPFKPEGKSYLTFSSSNRFTLAVYDATKHWNGILEYFSADKVWAVWDGTTTLSAVSDDGEYFLYLRGTGNKEITGFTNGQKYKWVLTGSEIACTGNIENLLDYGIVESGGHPTMASYCYHNMFYGCTALTQAPDLPATTLAISCYGSMFSGCSSLTQAPVLPTTTLKSYCYQLMFEGCTALTQAPALPATTLANYCYQLMFEGCTALTQAPALPATTLADHCYSSMFYGCTALTQAPALPATTLADHCYHNMFYGCTALTQAPDLPATTLADHCYESMFYGCTSLTKAPALPAKTLIGSCYSSMFYGCSSLTQAPELPATSLVTLVTNCYDKMFYGCRSIKLSSTQTGEYTQEYIVGYTSNYAYLMFYGTGGTFTGTPDKGTYYLSTDNMIVRDTEVATLNGYVGSMIDNSVSNPLNITGATVGQIAKITAVDESGKPTSWEAVDMPSGDKWEKVADIELRADTALYVLADFEVWRKAKVIMRRPKYVGGLNKNVWCYVMMKNDHNSRPYNCGYLTIEYGYVYWEFSAEVSNSVISSTTLRSNNINSLNNVLSTQTLTPLNFQPTDSELTLLFTDTSVIQDGDKVMVIGVRR